jgi:hypothetical protein
MFRLERKKQEIITGQKRTGIMIYISSYVIQLPTVSITKMIIRRVFFFNFMLLTEAEGFPELSVRLYQSKLRHIPEDGKLYNDGCSEQPYF